MDGRRKVTVPNVVGLPVEDARERIRGAELWVDSPRAESGTVSRQEPERGATLNPGQEVRIYAEADG